MLQDTGKTTTENTNVSIFFEDQGVSMLLAQLLQSIGISVQMLDSISDVEGETKVITEPQYFSDLNQSYQESCLLIGNKQALVGLKAKSISQPLTEEKIEIGLAQFLETPAQ